jgi:Flp pilus assembly protein TadD
MFGFVLVLLGLMRRLPGSRSSAVVLLVMVISCLLLSWQRNRLWADPIAFYQDNLAKTPGNERVLTDLSLLLQRDGQSAAAEKLLLQALESHPDYIPAMMGLIGAYNSQRRLSEALAVARRGVEKYPHSPVLLRALATLYSNSGDIERAVEILGCALEDNSEQVPLLIDRAIALARLGHLPEAEVDFRKALSLAPGNPEARNGLVLILKGQDKPVN